MRINCHCHVFNLQSVFTKETRDIFKVKLDDRGVPEQLSNLLLAMLTMILEKKSGVDLRADRNLEIADILRELKEYDERTKLFERDPKLSIGDVSRLLKSFTSRTDKSASVAVDKFVSGLNALFDPAVLDGSGTDIEDLLAYVSIGFARSMDQVTDKLMAGLDPDVAIVPLMMDITKFPKDDYPLFVAQTEGTRRQIFRYPGRVFPFFAVNPKRGNTLSLMKDSLGTGFVGVKLYPALNYSVTSSAMARVLAECDGTGTPLLMHCMRRGFNADRFSYRHGAPVHWKRLLEDHPGLRICFGHFGGDENLLAAGGPDKDSWTSDILDLMLRFEGRVYADLAAHTDCMTEHRLKNYFDNLNALIAGPHGKYILWGSDWFMIRTRISEKNFWKVFEKRISKENFKRISEENPVRFLGLPVGGNPMGENIRRQVEYMKPRADRFGEGIGSFSLPEWLAGQLGAA
ncbi:Amidohydrolase [Pseudodesulfovibrio hydrargyri]|uniref:Amidohydrolase n=1 Tax=Pseudodesulfovibrio hydrargyri TaxID=2125990 RepID=A0A1J5NKB5_9BACT|nr:amidohydrolase family protein [Pseudodesulfovibrio hydrargyri]OIQ52097.1 Amidohydrolase [Pseudodesulfovibrio hydrargyri]